MDAAEQQALESALERFNAIQPGGVCAFHQASFRVASSFLSDQFPRHVLKTVLEIEVAAERKDEMIEKLVVHPFVQGTRLYASQIQALGVDAPKEPQVPFEWIWRSYADLEQEEESEPALAFEEETRKVKELLPLASILAYSFSRTAIEEFQELAGKDEKLHQVLGVYIMAGIRFEFLYRRLMPELAKAVEDQKKKEEGSLVK